MKRIFLGVFFLCVVSALSFAHILGADQSFAIAPSQSLFLATQQTMPIDSLTPYNNGMPGSDRAKNLKTIGVWTLYVGLAAMVAGTFFTIFAATQVGRNWDEDENRYEDYDTYTLISVVLYSVGGIAAITGSGLWFIGNSRY